MDATKIDYEDKALKLVEQSRATTGIHSSTLLQEAIVFSQLHVARMTAELGKTIGSAPR